MHERAFIGVYTDFSLKVDGYMRVSEGGVKVYQPLKMKAHKLKPWFTVWWGHWSKRVVWWWRTEVWRWRTPWIHHRPVARSGHVCVSIGRRRSKISPYRSRQGFSWVPIGWGRKTAHIWRERPRWELVRARSWRPVRPWWRETWIIGSGAGRRSWNHGTGRVSDG